MSKNTFFLIKGGLCVPILINVYFWSTQMAKYKLVNRNFGQLTTRTSEL